MWETGSPRTHEPKIVNESLRLSQSFTVYLIFSEIGDFQKIVGTFIEVVDNVSKEVEKEKMKVTNLYPFLT